MNTPSKAEARERIISLIDDLNKHHGGVAYLGGETDSLQLCAADLSALVADWTLPPQHSSESAYCAVCQSYNGHSLSCATLNLSGDVLNLPQHSSGDARELLDAAYKAADIEEVTSVRLTKHFVERRDRAALRAIEAALSLSQDRPEGVGELVEWLKERAEEADLDYAADVQEGKPPLPAPRNFYAEALAALGSQDLPPPEGPFSWETREDHGDDSIHHMIDHEDGDLVGEAASPEWAARIVNALNASRSAPDGWVLVPREPTSDMIYAGEQAIKAHIMGEPNGTDESEAAYRAMLASSPSALSGEGVDNV